MSEQEHIRPGDVWVFIEQERGIAHPVSWELLGIGKQLAEKTGDRLAAILVGYEVDFLVEEAWEYGADIVYLASHPSLKYYRTYPYRKVIEALSRKYRPNIFLFGATTLGRDLAGAVATSLETGLTADATVLEVDGETRQLLASRPTFAENLMATIVCPDPKHIPQMVTVRPRTFPIPPKKSGRKGEVSSFEVHLPDEAAMPTRILEFIPASQSDTVALEYAEIIVSGGRGLGSRSGFDLIREVADVLGGKVGASRAVVDAGWISPVHQVGLTGKTVRPKLYLACGISGAIQHLVGMRHSDFIVAINTDPNAPIFQVADVAIVGDLYEILPLLIEEVKKHREEKGGKTRHG
ncbi:MAG: electron transfer flavoprotein subunit alpha/FixB family protein [bacterium JZ-2024 1]